MKSQSHKQVSISGLPDNFPETADAGCIDLVQYLNDAGLRTMNSCQGGSEQFECGYVQIDGVTFKGAMPPADFFASMMIEMDRRWVCALRKGECAGGEIEFYFIVAIGDGYIMRWHPSIYARVLDAAKKVIQPRKHRRAS